MAPQVESISCNIGARIRKDPQGILSRVYHYNDFKTLDNKDYFSNGSGRLHFGAIFGILEALDRVFRVSRV